MHKVGVGAMVPYKTGEIAHSEVHQHVVNVVRENDALRQLVSGMEKRFQEQESRMMLAAQTFAQSIRKDAEEREQRLQSQITQQAAQNRLLQAEVTQLNSQVSLQQGQNVLLEQRLSHHQQREQSQEARIQSVSEELTKTKSQLNVVQNQLAVANSAIAVSGLNDELRSKEQAYNRYRTRYVTNHKAYNRIFQKKMVIHGALSGTGLAVAGPVGFYALGTIGMANLIKTDADEVTLYRALVSDMSQMNTIRLELEGYATRNRLARDILANLRIAPNLPSPPPGYG